MNIMKGKLSYTLAALAVIGGAAGYFIHIVDGATAVEMIWGGLAVFGIRRAVAA